MSIAVTIIAASSSTTVASDGAVAASSSSSTAEMTAELLAHQQEIRNWAKLVKSKIYELETQYLEEPGSMGNIIRGWDVDGRTFPIRRTANVDDRERLFSSSAYPVWQELVDAERKHVSSPRGSTHSHGHVSDQAANTNHPRPASRPKKSHHKIRKTLSSSSIISIENREEASSAEEDPGASADAGDM